MGAGVGEWALGGGRGKDKRARGRGGPGTKAGSSRDGEVAGMGNFQEKQLTPLYIFISGSFELSQKVLVVTCSFKATNTCLKT